MEDYLPPEEDFFQAPATELAPGLLGCLLRMESPGGLVSGIIVETEAYTRDDPASHSFRGRTRRNWPMFRGGGLAYVYLIYGIHNCFNVTSGPSGTGQAVLIRALRPLEGLGLMAENRGVSDPEELCSGPGKLCQALGIDRSLNGESLREGRIRVLAPGSGRRPDVSVGPRIGVRSGCDMMRRFCLRNSPWISRRG